MAEQITVATAAAVAEEDTVVKAVASLAVSAVPVDQAAVSCDKGDSSVLEGMPSVAAVTASSSVDQTAPHRSHDPLNNQKRTDPFMFGQRFLTEEDNVFEYNAWDHVETDDAFKEYAEKQYELQRQTPVSAYDKTRFNGDPARWWNLFYKNNTANFFKDRKWLQQEFPILNRVCEPDYGAVTILEIGAGAGNTAFPILQHNRNPLLRLHACDFSKTAVQVMRTHASYDTHYMQADVWDVAGTGEQALPPGLGPASVDVAILVFIFSALAPTQWQQAVSNVATLVKPGGIVLFRDYGRGDLAQVRFRKGRYLEENFYIRGDGTRVYFFEKDELEAIWTGEVAKLKEAEEATDTKEGNKAEEPQEPKEPKTELETEPEKAPKFQEHAEKKFVLENMGVDRRLIVNRAMKLKMYRCWLQGRFRRV